MVDRYYEDQAVRNDKNRFPKRVRAWRVMQGFMIAFFVLGLLFLLYFFNLEPLTGGSPVWAKILYVILALMPIAAVVLLWFFARARIGKLTEEFDYVLNGSKFRIVRVVDNKRRKRFLEFDINSIEEMGCVARDSYEKALATPGIKKIYAIANSDDLEAISYVVFHDDKGEKLLHVELTPEMLREIRMSLGRELYRKD